MSKFTGVFASMLAFVILSATFTVVNAAPWPTYTKHSTHRRRTAGNLVLESYHPKTTFKTWGQDGAPLNPAGNSLTQPEFKDQAMAFVANLGVKPEELAWRSGYQQSNQGVAYLRQSYNNITFSNAVANIAFSGGNAASFGSSFIDTSTAKIAPPVPSVSWRDVLPEVESSLAATYNNINATLEYFVQPDGSVLLTHVIQLQNPETDAWYEAHIDAHSGKIAAVTDFVAHASYTVLPMTKVSFEEGLEVLQDPQDLESSPLGWHSIDQGLEADSTSGNNVLAARGQQLGFATNGAQDFRAAYDDTLPPTDRSNIEAAKTNAFFAINFMHDVMYRYGFTETAFNFQENNFGKGGRGEDRVLISVQDASGVNNANFATPPDGQRGVCRMFVWNLTPVQRDGTMENDILIHEMMHGVTNRMTGGGTGRCLQTLESAGLGEGWGDMAANWFQQSSTTTTDFAVGAYVTGRAGGLRQFPYSVNPQRNPLRYSTLRQFEEVHQIGEVWAQILHIVYADLVSELGFSADKFTNPESDAGNVVFMQLLIDALALQPCNPTFKQARDAFLQADENRYGGANKCTLGRSFASRGLGENAGSAFVDDTTLPRGC